MSIKKGVYLVFVNKVKKDLLSGVSVGIFVILKCFLSVQEGKAVAPVPNLIRHNGPPTASVSNRFAICGATAPQTYGLRLRKSPLGQ